MKKIRATGIAWFRREDWTRILEIMEDAEKIGPDFDRWEKLAKSIEERLNSQGVIVVRAMIDPDIFRDWCLKNSLPVDAKARTKYANEMAYEKVKASH